MSDRQTDRPIEDRFDEALRRWAARPPRTPAAEAARRIEERLPERSGRTGLAWRSLAAAAVLAAAVGLVALLAPSPTEGPSEAGAAPEAPLAVQAPPAPAGDVLVIDLDERTTLYLNLGTAGVRPSATAPGADRPTPPQGDRT